MKLFYVWAILEENGYQSESFSISGIFRGNDMREAMRELIKARCPHLGFNNTNDWHGIELPDNGNYLSENPK
jgi:hypothetical protein